MPTSDPRPKTGPLSPSPDSGDSMEWFYRMLDDPSYYYAWLAATNGNTSNGGIPLWSPGADTAPTATIPSSSPGITTTAYPSVTPSTYGVGSTGVPTATANSWGWGDYAQLAGNALSAYGDSQNASANRELQRSIAAAQIALNEPRMQQWRQGQAAMSEIMPLIRNYNVTPPGDLARFTPQVTGGVRVPENGFSADTLNFFTPQARLATEQQYYRQTAPLTGGGQPNLSSMGYGPLANSYTINSRQRAAGNALGQSATPRGGK